MKMKSAPDWEHETWYFHHILATSSGWLEASEQEILEVLLQARIYCGVAEAMNSMRVAKETFAEMSL